MKDEDMDNVFVFNKDEKEKDLIKQARSKSNIRIMGISFGIVLLTLVLASILKIQMTPWIVSEKTSEITSYYNIHGANTLLGVWQEKYKLIGSTAKTTMYKLVDGIPYKVDEIDIDDNLKNNKLNMGIGDDWTTYQDAETFSYKGEHIMKFYHPELEYNNYKNDLNLLEKIQTNKKIEMSISFDKSYTIEEIKNMLPQEVTWNWNWVNTFDEDSIASIKQVDNGITYTPNIILEEDEVIGFSMINNVGEIKQNPKDEFMENIKSLIRSKGKYKQEAKDIYNILKNKDNIEIIGVVISGEKEELSKLIGKPFIKASSFGVITEVY